MIIKSVRVRNFRCIKDETLNCDSLTALVGPNGSGKSTFLKAIDFFYQPSSTFIEEDFYGGNVDEPISICVIFTDLSDSTKEEFKDHMEGDDLLVEKWVRYGEKISATYRGYSLRNEDFEVFRNLGENEKEKKRLEYDELRKSKGYSDLPELRANAAVKTMEDYLVDWERKNPERLKLLRDQGGHFGFGSVGKTHLERYTRFLYIPSDHDASRESLDGRGTIINEIMDLVVRSKLAHKEEIRKFEENVNQRHMELLNPNNIPELKLLESDLTNTIASFAPETRLRLTWSDPKKIEIPQPIAKIRIVEEGFETDIDRVGDGVKRAFIMAALQHLEAARAQTNDERGERMEAPCLIIGIEEPELFQHPTRERHIAKLLWDLAKGEIKGVAEHMQILYTTHSPLMVDLTRFDHVRILNREDSGIEPRATKMLSSTMDKVAREMERVKGDEEGSHDVVGERSRLHTLMTPWTNEGFFAKVIVLVEGEGDRAAIIGSAESRGIELDRSGISIIPCGGKSEVLKATVIFRSFDLKVYPIWDCDNHMKNNNEVKKAKEENRPLFTLFDRPNEAIDCIEDHFACFENCLDIMLKKEIPDYDKRLSRLNEKYCYNDIKRAKKNPVIIGEIIRSAGNDGHQSRTMGKILEKVMAMANKP